MLCFEKCLFMPCLLIIAMPLENLPLDHAVEVKKDGWISCSCRPCFAMLAMLLSFHAMLLDHVHNKIKMLL